MLTRYENWPDRLAAFFAARLDDAFEWGVNDCAIFAADAVRAITGEDLAAGFRGRYSSEASAAALLDAFGGIEAILDRALPRRATPLLAQRGDLAITSEGALVVVEGRYAIGPGPDGSLRVPLRACAVAWKV